MFCNRSIPKLLSSVILPEYIHSWILFASVSSAILFFDSSVSWLFVQSFITDRTPLLVNILTLNFRNLIDYVGSLQSPSKIAVI